MTEHEGGFLQLASGGKIPRAAPVRTNRSFIEISIMKRIIEIVRKFQKDIRSKYFSNFCNIQHDNNILSFDLEMMGKFNFSTIKSMAHILFYVLFLAVSGVSFNFIPSLVYDNYTYNLTMVLF